MVFIENRAFVRYGTICIVVAALLSYSLFALHYYGIVSHDLLSTLGAPLVIVVGFFIFPMLFSALIHATRNRRYGWLILLVLFSWAAAIAYGWLVATSPGSKGKPGGADSTQVDRSARDTLDV